MAVEAVLYSRGRLQLLDQVLMPHSIQYIEIRNVEDAYLAIKNMNVRGAPAIAVAGLLSLAVDLNTKTFGNVNELCKFVVDGINYLVSARPTAVNIAREGQALKDVMATLLQLGLSIEETKEQIIIQAEDILQQVLKTDRSIGFFGAQHILDKVPSGDLVTILTHCNAGALATGGYGTALGVIRSLNKLDRLRQAICTETRPYCQGARLTAFELVQEGIDTTLIIDSAVSIAMERKNITAVVVGADRVARNGDTANKIGTFQIAISAKHHGVLFYVAAPISTIDLNVRCGKDIIIEERSPEEVTHQLGSRIAASGVNVWNPSFDVTPAELITGGIITEFGVFSASDLHEKLPLVQEEASKTRVLK